MKLFKNLFPAILCICILFSTTGCQPQCGGIIKNFELKEEFVVIREDSMLFGIVESGYYPQLTVTFKQDTTPSSNCFCSQLTIFTYDFEDYNANNLKELLSVTEFLNIVQTENRITLTQISENISTSTTYFGGTDKIAYLLYYDFYEDYIESPIIENLLDYSGYIKIN